MVFYLYTGPPDCMIDIETVELLVLKRFQLYSAPGVLQNDTEELIHHDRISHLFMLFIVIEYPYFKDVFFKGEIKLFKEKIKLKKHLVIKQALAEALQYLRSLSQSEEYKMLKIVFGEKFQFIQSILQAILSKSSHSFNRYHPKTCRKYKLILPFKFLLDPVAKREVEVKNGKVYLSCGQWDQIMEVIFKFLLHIELKLLENCKNLRKKLFESEDDRIRQIIRRFINFLNGNLNEKRSKIKASEIDKKSLYFPPCMANLHQILRRTHRLSYSSSETSRSLLGYLCWPELNQESHGLYFNFLRCLKSLKELNKNNKLFQQPWLLIKRSLYQYALFLKDIGVSVDENIKLWETEYSKPHENSACTHVWDKSQRRYKYQIEHLYGLIGNHEIKSSHPCEKFIKELEAKMDGGCPFQHLTLEELEKALPKSVQALPDVEDIFINKKNGFPQKACAVYLNCLQKVLTKQKNVVFDDEVNVNKSFYIVSPLQFFNIAKTF